MAYLFNGLLCLSDLGNISHFLHRNDCHLHVRGASGIAKMGEQFSSPRSKTGRQAHKNLICLIQRALHSSHVQTVPCKVCVYSSWTLRSAAVCGGLKCFLPPVHHKQGVRRTQRLTCRGAQCSVDNRRCVAACCWDPVLFLQRQYWSILAFHRSCVVAAPSLGD